MANHIPTPALGTLGNSPTIQSAKAHSSALLCFALALLTMATTAWFVVEGINATEPDSPARWAKVASGVLLLVLEASAFGLAGQWPEHSKVLRALGWAVLALEITLMSVSQISIGMTAAKSASNGAGTIDEIRAQAKESRAAAEALRADAANLRGSKHGWLKQQAGERSAAAAEQTKSAAAAVASLEKHSAATVSTPIVEIVGKGGLIALSIALSVALSLSGIVLMHVAGSLRRRADGALPVDQQILELLHKIHGGTAAPAQTAPATAAPAEPVEPVAPAPAEPVETAKPTRPFWLEKEYGFIGSKTKKAPAERVNDDMAERVNDDTPAPMKTDVSAPGNGDVLTGSKHVNDDTPEASTKARKQRVARDGAVMDSGTGPLDGFRYRRAVAGVKAGKIQPTYAGLYEGVGVTAPTAKRFLGAMADAGVVVREGTRYFLADKYLAKKGGAK